MNVLYVIHYRFFGGPQNQALRLAQPLARRGVATVVVLPDEPGNAAERLRAGAVDVVSLPLHRLRAVPDPLLQVRFLASMPEEVATLRRLIRQRSIDVVQVGGLVNPHAAIAARLEGVGVVWQLLDTRAPMMLRRLIMPWVIALADVVMTTGAGVARVHPGAAALGSRLVPFYPPVDTSVFTPGPDHRASARAEFGLGTGGLLVGTVANLNPQKGLEHFIAVAEMPPCQPPGRPVRHSRVGDGDARGLRGINPPIRGGLRGGSSWRPSHRRPRDGCVGTGAGDGPVLDDALRGGLDDGARGDGHGGPGRFRRTSAPWRRWSWMA